MQTFLPYECFVCTARVLDVRRLGKQRVEAYQVLRALTIPGYGWRRHPAVLMWRGHEEALVTYGVTMSRMWRRRGFADTVEPKLLAESGLGAARDQRALAVAGALPPWLGDAALHRSHRSALVRKDPAHYRRWFPDIPDDLPYYWPVTAADGRDPASRARTSPHPQR